MTDTDEIQKINEAMKQYYQLQHDVDEHQYNLANLIKNAIESRVHKVGYYVEQEGNWQVELPLGIYIKNKDGAKDYYCYLTTESGENHDTVNLGNDETNVSISRKDDFIYLYECLYRMGFWWDDYLDAQDVA